jgi:hypothetical protein
VNGSEEIDLRVRIAEISLFLPFTITGLTPKLLTLEMGALASSAMGARAMTGAPGAATTIGIPPLS